EILQCHEDEDREAARPRNAAEQQPQRWLEIAVREELRDPAAQPAAHEGPDDQDQDRREQPRTEADRQLDERVFRVADRRRLGVHRGCPSQTPRLVYQGATSASTRAPSRPVRQPGGRGAVIYVASSGVAVDPARTLAHRTVDRRPWSRTGR